MEIINEKKFEKEINGDELVLVDFFATWCMPCRMLGPVLEAVAEEVKDYAKVFKIDIDKSEELAKKMRIFSVPTMLLFKNGEQIESIVGLKSKDDIVALIEKHK